MRDDAVSELVGTLLLMAVAVVLVAGFVLVLFAVPGPSSQAHSQIQTYILPTTPDQLVLEHRGGPPVPLRELTARVTVNGAPTSYVVGDHLGSGWTVLSPAGSTKAATDRFSVGDRAVFTSASLKGAAVSAQVVDTEVAALVVRDTPVQVADAVAPTFLNARVSGPTTITVNFTERLSAIAAAEFTVTGFTLSSATLVGNGSAAELVVASPGWTPDQTPAVNSVAGPITTTRDIAGNAFATSQSVTPVDRLAPGITVAPSATAITTTTATITWTTNESSTSKVLYGPTPADLGLTATGPSGTAHSVGLSLLTDAFTYYYAVESADAAGNTVRSATGTFTTASIPGGGGAADGAPPHHLTINMTSTAISGLTSGVFHVGLRNGNNQPVAPTSPLTVVLSTNSSTGYFMDSAGTSVVQTVTIGTGQTFAAFRYVDFKPPGYSTVTAMAFNTTPDAVAVQITGNSGKGAPYHLDFSTRSTSVASGGTTSTFTITLKDIYDNPITAPYPLTIDLGTNSSLGWFTSGGAIVGSVTLNTGFHTTAAITYTEHRAQGFTLLTATTNATTTATMVVTVTGGASTLAPGQRLVFTAVPQPITAGILSNNFRVELRDEADRAVPSAGTVTVRLLTNSTRGYFTSTGSTTPIQSVNITGGSNFAEFRYVDARTGVAAIMGVSNGTYPAVALVGVAGRSAAGEPDHLVFTTTVASATAGAASGTFTIALRNGWGETVAPPGGSLVVTLSTNSSKGVFVNNADTNQVINSVTIGAAGTASFQYRDFRVAGRSVLLALAPNVGTAVAGIDISGGAADPLPPDQLVFTAANGTIFPGFNSSTYTVSLRTYQNVTKTAAADLYVRLSTNSTDAMFLDPVTNSTVIQGVFIRAGQSAASFKYVDFRPRGTSVVLATADNVIPASVIVNVTWTPVVPQRGDGIESIRLELNAGTAQARNKAAVPLTFAIINPTTKDLTISSITFEAHQISGANTQFFSTPRSNSPATDTEFSGCTWSATSVGSLHTITCTVSATIPSRSVRQVAITFDSASLNGNGNYIVVGKLVATAPTATTLSSAQQHIRHAANGNHLTVTPLSGTGGSPQGKFTATGGTANDFYVAFSHRNGGFVQNARITIPAGWTNLTVPSQSALSSHNMAVMIQEPTATDPGHILITTSATSELRFTANPPATPRFELIRMDAHGTEGSIVFTTHVPVVIS